MDLASCRAKGVHPSYAHRVTERLAMIVIVWGAWALALAAPRILLICVLICAGLGVWWLPPPRGAHIRDGIIGLGRQLRQFARWLWDAVCILGVLALIIGIFALLIGKLGWFFTGLILYGAVMLGLAGG